MKRLVFLILLFSQAFGQVRISDMTTYIGNPNGGWVPVVISGANRKVDPSFFGYNKIDSIDVIQGTAYDTIKAFKNGVYVFYKLTRAGAVTQQSITGTSLINLVNDQTTPGNGKYYGTNYSGTRGYVGADVDWYNIVKAGADNTGGVDVSSYITAAIAAGKKTVYLPDGTFLLSSTIQLKDSVKIIGAGKGRTYIKLTSNITAFSGSNFFGGHATEFTGFTFTGTNGTTGTTSQKGIVLDSVYNSNIHDIGGYLMGGFVVTIKNNALLGGDKFTYGNKVSKNYFQQCYGGALFLDRGEYNSFDDNTVVSGTYGVVDSSGNMRITGNNCSLNNYNIWIGTGTNDGHGIVANNTFNHANIENLHVNGLTIGMTFVGNHFYVGAIILINCTNVVFVGGDISVSTITATSASNCSFDFVRFHTTPTWTITTSTINVLGNSQSGFTIADPANSNITTEISNTNGSIYYGGSFLSGARSGVSRHNFYQPLITQFGQYDPPRDFSAGAARFGDGSFGSMSDMVQIYRTGSTGSTLAVLDNAAHYMLRAMPAGNIGLGNNTTPAASALLDMTSTTQGLLPPRMTAAQRTAISSPAAALVVYDTDSARYMLRNASAWKGLAYTSELAGAGGTSNVNIGSNYRWLKELSQQMRTDSAGYGIITDSSFTSLIHRVDSNNIATRSEALHFIDSAAHTTTVQNGIYAPDINTIELGTNLLIKNTVVSGAFRMQFGGDMGNTNTNKLHRFDVNADSINIINKGEGFIRLLGILQMGQGTAANNAAYTIPSGQGFTILPNPTGNFNVTLPNASEAGRFIVIWCQSTSTNHWSFASNAKDASNATLTTLTNSAFYVMISDGTNYIKVF